jgi:short-subunit dehydrogenase
MLVNNAGFGVHAPITSPDTGPHDRALEVMGRAVLVLSGAAARAMRARGSGAIVNVSSTAGFVTMGSYSAVKAFVTSLTEGLANELHGTGVTVTALCPGWVRTEFHERAGIRSSSIPDALWLDADRLVETSLRDVRRGRVISMPGFRYRVLIWFARHLPRSTVRWVSRRISSSRSDGPAH